MSTIETIMIAASLAGVTVAGIVEFFKSRFPVLGGWKAVLLAAVCSLASVLVAVRYQDITMSPFDMAVYALATFGASQGFYFGAVGKPGYPLTDAAAGSEPEEEIG